MIAGVRIDVSVTAQDRAGFTRTDANFESRGFDVLAFADRRPYRSANTDPPFAGAFR